MADTVQPAPAPPPRDRVTRRTLLLGGLALGVAAGGAGEAVHWLAGRAPRPIPAQPSLSLDGTWQFRRGDTPNRQPPDATAGDWQGLQVPGYLSPCYLDRTHRPWVKFPFDEDVRVGWYARTFGAPAALDGAPVLLRFGAVATDAEVWLNGKQVGRHRGGYTPFALDVSAALRPGGSNTIAVRVESADSLRGNAAGFSVPNGAHNSTVGIWQSVTLERQAWLGVEELFVQPTTTSADISFTLVNRQHRPARRVAATAAIVDAQGQQFAARSLAPVDLPPLGRQAVSVKFDGLQPRLWEPASPNLYQLVLTVAADGLPPAAESTRFGFRTFETKADAFYLNGRPIFLRGSNHPPQVFIQNNKPVALRYLKLMRDAGSIITRFHMEPPSPDWLEAADELGMLAILEGPVVAENFLWQDAAFIDEVKAEYREMMAALRNHPSIVIWSLGNEMGPTPTSPALPAMRPVLDEARRLDPTRPILGEAGQAGNRFLNFGDIQDYHDYAGWYTGLIKDIEYWRTNGGLKSLANVPLTFTEYLGAYTRVDTGAFYDDPRQRTAGLLRIGRFGDRTKQALWYQAFAMKETTELIRRARQPETRIAGALPFASFTWFYDSLEAEKTPRPKPAYDAFQQAMAPILVSIELWDRHAFANTTIQPVVYAINDDPAGRDLKDVTLHYALNDESGRLLLQGSQRIGVVPYYRSLPVKLPLRLPDLAGKQRCTLAVALQSGGHTLAQNSMDLLIAPSAWAKVGAPTAAVGLFDPAKTTAAALASLAIPHTLLDNLDGLPNVRTLVIGQNGLAPLLAKFADAPQRLDAFVQGGGRVLVLEQEAKGSAPLRFLAGLAPIAPRTPEDGGLQRTDFLDIEESAHPAFAGLDRQDFRLWNTLRGDLNMAVGGFQELSQARVLLSTYVWQQSEQVKVPSERVPVTVELPAGKGVYLFSQAAATERVPTDPIAAKYVANLLQSTVQH